MKAKVYRFASLIIALLVAVFAVGYAFAWLVNRKDTDIVINGTSDGAYFDSGNGSEENPFIIANPTHMHNLAALQNTGRFVDENGNPKKYYFEIKETVDEINMAGRYMPPIGNDEHPFIGDFNGKGKTVSNFIVTTNKNDLALEYPMHATEDYEFSQAVGLFGMTGKDSNLHNVILKNPEVRVTNPADAGVDTKYKATGAANKVVGLAVGYVAGKCSSIGVRAIDEGSTLLDVDVTGYSTFNSILGELANGVESSVTGGGAGSEGTGGSGNAFGASFDVESLLKRLENIYRGKYDKDYKKGANETALNNLLPLIDTQSANPVPALGYKVPFTVDSAKSIYDAVATAQEIAANNNVGYVMGNQNKISTKTLKFASDEPSKDSMIRGNDGTYTMPDGSAPTNNNVPRWFYVQDDGWENSHYQERVGFGPISEEKYNELPANLKKLLVTESKNQRTYVVMRMQAEFNEYDKAPISTSALNALTWGYHGQISWMGNTYGKGFADNEGYAIDENGNYYTTSGTLLGDDGYDRDADGYYGVDVFDFANFPYIVYSIEEGASWNTAYALDANGNRYLRYGPEGSGEYVYGIINGGYLMTGDGYQYYVAPVAGWTAPIPLIDANGYAMASAGVYYDVSGNIVVGGYVKDENGLYVPADGNFLLPITQFDGNKAQDADGNYYGAIILNGKTVYCYLDADGNPTGYNGFYVVNGNNFLVAAVADEKGVKYNDTDYYGTYDGISGYIDANGYFYDVNHNYVAKEGDFTEVKKADADGSAMTADGVYFGKGETKDQYGNAGTVYGYLVEKNNDKFYLTVDGKYLSTDGTPYDFIDDNGYIMFDDTYHYGTYTKQAYTSNNGYARLDDNDFVLDDDGYYLFDLSGWQLMGHKVCEDPTNENYGYIINADTGELYINSFDNKPVKGSGYRLSSNNRLLRENEDTGEWEEFQFIGNGQHYATPMPGTKLQALEGKKISVEKGTYTEAISSDDINNATAEFITLKEIEKVKVVEEGASGIANVIVKQGSKVQLYAFKSGIALPNNGLWFKPSQAGKMRFVMFAQSDSESFSLLKCTRTNATLDDPFYTNGEDITVQKVIQQRLPVYALFYYEFEVKAEEVYNTEYVIMIDNNVNGNGAFFLYLDIGSSATEEVTDTSTVVADKISAVDFIYDGVEIEQTDTTIGIGNFIVNTSGEKALYDSSKTSVYFENITSVLKIVYLRLHDETGKHSGKTICLEGSDPALNTSSEVVATFTTYVCPTISGGSGTVSGGGGGGGGTVTPTPDPGPDDPTPSKTEYAFSYDKLSGVSELADNAKLSQENFTGDLSFITVEGNGVTYRTSPQCIQSKGSGLSVEFKGTGTITIVFSSTGGQNESRIGLKKSDGTYIVATELDSGITAVTDSEEGCYSMTGAGSGVSITFTVTEAGTYIIDCPSGVTGRATRIFSIDMVDNT